MVKTRPQSGLSWIEGIKAIGLDTNAFGTKYPNLSKLEGLVEQVRKRDKLRIWLPETVVWEWAEHIHAERQRAVEALNTVRSAGLTDVAFPTKAIEEVLSELIKDFSVFAPELEVISVHKVAASALRDQILKTGPGRAKLSGGGISIKTGGADSATLRAFREKANDDSTSYVIVSKDSDYARAFNNWGKDPPE